MNVLARTSAQQWMLAGVLVAGGIVVLAWNQWVRDDDDAKWTQPAWLDRNQPPAQIGAGLPTRPPCGPTEGCGGRPMDPGAGIRTRQYPGSLAEASFSIIGEF